jgi:hypothetical protein
MSVSIPNSARPHWETEGMARAVNPRGDVDGREDVSSSTGNLTGPIKAEPVEI